MEEKHLRYIVVMLNPDTAQYLSTGQKIETHSGAVFRSRQDAKKYAQESIKEKLCTRFAIGEFVLDSSSEKSYIELLETYGFKNDKSKVVQLEFFSK